MTEDRSRQPGTQIGVLLLAGVLCFPVGLAIGHTVGAACVVLGYALAVTAGFLWVRSTPPPPGQRRRPPGWMQIRFLVWLAAGSGLGIAALASWLLRR